MNMTTLNMPKLQAWNAYREYRSALGQNANQKDKAVMAAYRAIAKGKTVIDLVQVMKEGGTFENGLPRLAVIRADAKDCYAERYNSGSCLFSSEKWWRQGSSHYTAPADTFERRTGDTIRGKATIPSIPPKFRPRPTTLKQYWILWEADWKVVPKDPALLKKLSGNLFAVVATWDLTPIEQAVLRQ